MHFFELRNRFVSPDGLTVIMCEIETTLEKSFFISSQFQAHTKSQTALSTLAVCLYKTGATLAWWNIAYWITVWWTNELLSIYIYLWGDGNIDLHGSWSHQWPLPRGFGHGTARHTQKDLFLPFRITVMREGGLWWAVAYNGTMSRGHVSVCVCDGFARHDLSFAGDSWLFIRGCGK